MRLLPLACAICCLAQPTLGQTLVVESFDASLTTGSVLAGTSWVGNVTQNATSITVGGTATDVNGWSASGLTVNATGMNFLTVMAQRNSGNAAAQFAIQFEDAAVNTFVVSVNASAFSADTPTQVQIPLPAASGFDVSQIKSWSLGGGGLGVNLFRMILESLSFESSPLLGATLAPMGTSRLTSPLTGSAGLTINGSGTLILGTANTFSGDVVVTAGTLELGATDALPSGSPVSLASGATLNLAGYSATLGRLEGTGNVVLGSATLSVAQTSNSTFSGAISGTGGIAKSGTGTLTLSGTHTFTGATAITGGQLKLNGSAASSAFNVSGGTLSGTGTVGTLTVAAGGTLAPGNSPGTLNASNTTWAGGGNFALELNQATGGTAGTTSGWDLLAITGTLNIAATNGNAFTVGINTLTLGNTPGVPANFSDVANYAFTFVTTTSGITGFNPNVFSLNTSNVDGSLTGSWSLGLANSNRNLTLIYTAVPEPETYAGILGLAALAFVAFRRRTASPR